MSLLTPYPAVSIGIIGCGQQLHRLRERCPLGLRCCRILGGDFGQSAPPVVAGADHGPVAAPGGNDAGGFEFLVGPGNSVGRNIEDPGKVPHRGKLGTHGQNAGVGQFDDSQPQLLEQGNSAVGVRTPVSREITVPGHCGHRQGGTWAAVP